MLADYPNHLARLYRQQTLREFGSLAQYYSLQGGFYPYLPLDLLVGPLGRRHGPRDSPASCSSLLSPAMPVDWHARPGARAARQDRPMADSERPVCLQPPPVMGPRHFSVLARPRPHGVRRLDRHRAMGMAEAACPVLVLASLMFCSHPFAFGAFGLLIGAWELGRTPARSWPELKQTGHSACASRASSSCLRLSLHPGPASRARQQPHALRLAVGAHQWRYCRRAVPGGHRRDRRILRIGGDSPRGAASRACWCSTGAWHGQSS